MSQENRSSPGGFLRYPDHQTDMAILSELTLMRDALRYVREDIFSMLRRIDRRIDTMERMVADRARDELKPPRTEIEL